MDLIWEKLSCGHVLLSAPRRFGKTSIMYRLIDQPRWQYKVFLADLEHLREPAEFVALLLELLLKDPQVAPHLQGLSYLPPKPWSGFRKMVEEIELYKLRVKLREELRPKWPASGNEMFEKLSASTLTTVIILDEFAMMIDGMVRSEAGREQARSLLRWLRTVRQSPSHQNIRFLVGGSIGLGNLLKRIGEMSAVNDFEQVRLEPFSRPVAEEFLGKLARGQSTPMSAETKRKILDLIGIPVPYFIQVLFSEVRKVSAQSREAITPKIVERVYHERVLGVECKTYFEHYYGRLREYYPPELEKPIKRILRELAVVGKMSRDACFQFYRGDRGEAADLEEFNGLMDELENDFYICFKPRQHRYEFACKLLRDWWLRHYGMKLED